MRRCPNSWWVMHVNINSTVFNFRDHRNIKAVLSTLAQRIFLKLKVLLPALNSLINVSSGFLESLPVSDRNIPRTSSHAWYNGSMGFLLRACHTFHPGDKVTSGNLSWMSSKNLKKEGDINMDWFLRSTFLLSQVSTPHSPSHFLLSFLVLPNYIRAEIGERPGASIMPRDTWHADWRIQGSNHQPPDQSLDVRHFPFLILNSVQGSVSGLPASIDWSYKAWDVGASEDVCIQPHRSVYSLVAFLLFKQVQWQTHWFQSLKVQLDACKRTRL